jgi:hypothetical protein
MKAAELAKWNNERRWDYAHAILSLDSIAPLYDYTGIPFEGELRISFRELLGDYYRQVYLAPRPSAMALPDKRDLLLRRVTGLVGSQVRDAYIAWLLQVFVYLPRELTPGWSEWRSIIMRCSVREGWWSKLGLPDNASEATRQDLDEAKTRTDDAREVESSLKEQPRSEWDQQVMAHRNMGAQAIAAGEPFSAIILTTGLFQFSGFWYRLLERLEPADANQLWERGKAVAVELKIAPESVLHPTQLHIEPILAL